MRPEPYDIKMDAKAEKCPESYTPWLSDMAHCELDNGYCRLETDNQCVIYDEWLKER